MTHARKLKPHNSAEQKALFINSYERFCFVGTLPKDIKFLITDNTYRFIIPSVAAVHAVSQSCCRITEYK